MTSLVTSAEIVPLHAITHSPATAECTLNTSAAPERRTRGQARPGCHSPCQAIEL